jgi:ABC-type amino acid transport substrate-binding protein
MRRTLLLAALLVGLIQPAAADTLDKIRQSGTIVLGVRQDAKPFSFIDGQGQAAGYSVQVCQAVVQSLATQLALPDLKTEYKLVTAENRFTLLQTGEVDLDCGVTTYTLGRLADVDFSLLIFATGVDLMVRSEAKIGGLADLADKTIGVLAGATAEADLTELMKAGGVTANIVTLPSYTDMLASLETDEVQAVFGDRALLLEARNRALNPQHLKVLSAKYSYEPYALALRRGDYEFRQAVDTALARLYRTAQIGKIHEVWFGPLEADSETAALYRLLGLPD